MSPTEHDIPDEWAKLAGEAIEKAVGSWNIDDGEPWAFQGRAALSAVLPMVEKRIREACANVAEARAADLDVSGGYDYATDYRDFAAAIRQGAEQ